MSQQYGPQGESSPESTKAFVDTSLTITAATLPVFATIAVILRFVAKRRKVDAWIRVDDWIIVVTLILCWAHSINTLVAGGIGGINVIKVDPLAYANIALRTLWISGFLLVTSLFTVKISILLFYYHLFSVSDRFRLAVKIMIGVLCAWWFSSFMCELLATTPISGNWDASKATHRFDFYAWYITYSGMSIVFDVMVLCFPIPMIRGLRGVSTRQKVSILGIFWLGAFVCVTAVVRFVFLYEQIYRLTSLGRNQYSSITSAFIWSEIEPNTAVIAACLPTYGPLFSNSRFGLSGVRRSLRYVMSYPGRVTGFGSRSAHSGEDVEVGDGSRTAGELGYLELDKIGEVVEKDRGKSWLDVEGGNKV